MLFKLVPAILYLLLTVGAYIFKVALTILMELVLEKGFAALLMEGSVT